MSDDEEPVKTDPEHNDPFRDEIGAMNSRRARLKVETDKTVDEEDNDDDDYSAIADGIGIEALDEDDSCDEELFASSLAADQQSDGATKIEDDRSVKDGIFLDSYPTSSHDFCVNQSLTFFDGEDAAGALVAADARNSADLLASHSDFGFGWTTMGWCSSTVKTIELRLPIPLVLQWRWLADARLLAMPLHEWREDEGKRRGGEGNLIVACI